MTCSLLNFNYSVSTFENRVFTAKMCLFIKHPHLGPCLGVTQIYTMFTLLLKSGPPDFLYVGIDVNLHHFFP